jgi:hypothetical protein
MVTSETTRVIGVLSGTKREGPWRPSPTTQAVAVLGSCTLDMRRAEFDAELQMNAVAVFGSVEIIVRPDVDVDLSGTSIMGSKDVKGARADGSGSGKRIRVKAFSLFGSVTVKRKA